MAQLAFPDLTLALPEIFLGAAAMVLLMVGVFSKESTAARTVSYASILVLLFTIVLVGLVTDGRAVTFGGTFITDTFAVFMKALVNTLTFALFIVPLQGGGALLLALLINQKLRGINAFRTIYFMPVVISIVVISLLWRFIYSGNEGLLNNILEALTFGAFTPVDWLGSTDTALGSIIAMSAWQAVGFHMVIWLAGLQTISPTLYEAAAIEGASKWQTFRYVTWPGLRNTAVLVLIVITMQSFAVFAQIDVMTNGGPLDSTQTLVFQTVERGYGKQDISGGATISVILFLMVLMISAVQAFLTRERN